MRNAAENRPKIFKSPGPRTQKNLRTGYFAAIMGRNVWVTVNGTQNEIRLVERNSFRYSKRNEFRSTALSKNRSRTGRELCSTSPPAMYPPPRRAHRFRLKRG